MALSDSEIWREIQDGNIIVKPPTSIDKLDPHSLNVHLSEYIYTFKTEHPAIKRAIDLSHPEVAYSLQDLLDKTSIPEQGFELGPTEFVISYTREVITLPNNIAARIEGRSTNARFGLTIHSTAPTIHPTYNGIITLEICNLGKIPILLKSGLAIGQLVFEYIDGTIMKELQSAWQNQQPL